MSKLIQFTKDLEDDLGWRKKEISNLILLANEDNELIIVKSSILLIYAHWEGYVKNACKGYLKYISDQKINLNMLAVNFEAIQFKGMFSELEKSADTLTLTNELKFLNSIYSVEDKVFKVNKTIQNDKDKSIINTKDNLNVNVLNSLLEITGIDKRECINSKDKFINEMLLNNRNKIAHGNKISGYDSDFNIKIEDTKKIRDLVFIIMDSIKEDFIHYAENELYLYSKKDLCEKYNKKSNKELGKKIISIT